MFIGLCVFTNHVVCLFVYMLCCLCFVFFFFKQKTAYEMRISDWSSDVCSSDLIVAVAFDKVLAGLDAAKAAGLQVKINCVALKGVNDDEEIGRASCRERVCQYV